MEGDRFLLEKLAKYDAWMREGKVPFGSQVVPVGEAFRPQQWVLPTQQALEILRNSRCFALRPCACRSHYRRCRQPLETCLVTNDVAEAGIKAGDSRAISLAQAEEVLRLADRHGLVHLAVYNPEQYVWAVCSCCPCCCYQMQFLKKLGRADLMARADYVALRDDALCDHCGVCAGRCQFGAREQGPDGEVRFYPEKCYGCGLCVTTCRQAANRLELRKLAGPQGT
ncbi:MAG: hypothetical protein K6T75_11015 [Acetobacteraceae bacterium]|nr:hypothetical protein [Acetobacteraceae bacterium]